MGGTDESIDAAEGDSYHNQRVEDDSSSAASTVSAEERHKNLSSRHHRHRDSDDDHRKKKRKKEDRKKKKKKKKHHRHHHKRSDSDSGSDNDDNDDEEEEGKSKSRRHKKKHRSSREEKGPDDETSLKKGSSIQDTQPTFGKYGIVKESDFRTSSKIRRSFEVWLEEIKGIPQGSNVTKNEMINYFKDYAEDFNTATLPHTKFYDYDKWETEEYERKKNEVMKGGTSTSKSDEFFHREEMVKKEQDKRRREMELIRSGMTREKVEEMKHQAQLKAEMVNAYKTGDEEKRKRLQKRLEPEEDDLKKR